MKKIKDNKIIIGSIIGILVLGFGAFSLKDKIISTENTPKKVVKNNASWGDDYPTLDSIKSSSDLIVKGKVLEQLPSYEIKADSGFKDVLTDFKVKVIKTYFTKEKFNKEDIIIYQGGGTINETLYEPPSPVEFLEKDKDYILLLKYVPQFDKYSIVGEFPGLFKLNNGNAENIGLEKEKNLKFDEIDLEQKLKN